MAVTYPARRLYQIKRGDSWEAVAQKSKGECLAIHLPLLQTGQSSTLQVVVDDGNVETAYDQIYNLSVEDQERSIKEEMGKQRFANEGKACLERYRLASTRIFGVVLESLEELLGRGNFILERASIDELFLDVTDYCAGAASSMSLSLTLERVVDNTVRVGNTDLGENHPSVVQVLKRGCWVAKSIRQAVFDKLGFTLSAGISTSKLVAKLGATYGKPDGQALIYPSAIPFVMNETPIRKVRNLGGKIGKSVAALLPEGMEPTMGNLANYLSLPEMSEVLGPETAQRVFDNARGMDEEEVKETVGALVKSITAFKSFFQASLESNDVLNWFNLLATDIVSRVQQDVQRNSRYPKSCTVQYHFSRKVGAERKSPDRITKSLRIPFPKENETDKKEMLVTRAKEAILQREGSVFLHRIGLCAMEFETRMVNGGIASFFGKKQDMNKGPGDVVGPVVDAGKPASTSDEDLARKLERQYSSDANAASDNTKPAFSHVRTMDPSSCGGLAIRESRNETIIDRDLELARKLQATYDRENSLLTTMERRKPAKRMRIDNFFRSSGK